MAFSEAEQEPSGTDQHGGYAKGDSGRSHREWLSSHSRISIPNTGSTCRDYCATERTYLSHMRLCGVLLTISVSLLLQSRFPWKDGTVPDTYAMNQNASLPLGTMYAAAAVLAASMGFLYYEHGLRGLTKGKGFLEGDLPVYDYTMGGITLLILATAIRPSDAPLKVFLVPVGRAGALRTPILLTIYKVPMEFDPTTHPHRRYNPLTGEHVIVSPHRMKRPWHGQTEEPSKTELPRYDPGCYLCPGNSRTNGENNGSYESTHVFSNDFPAVLPPPGPVPPSPPHPLLRLEPVQGICDVIIFHPRHDLTLAQLEPADIEKVIEEWKNIYQLRGSEDGINYVQIFENKGAMMGCSNPHPHGQVWSLSEVPQLPTTELLSLRRFSEETQPSDGAPKGPGGKACMLCEYAYYEAQVAEGEGRVVVKNDNWIALVPWWAVWPFEILLLPYQRHIPSLLELSPEEACSLAEILSRVTVKYDNLFKTSFAYSMGIHQRPTPLSGDDTAHLHLHFDPPLLRSATVRKFLVGFELMSEPQRDLTAEQAAQRLRDCSDIHYLK